MKSKFYKVPDPANIVGELGHRLDAIEVKGDSVEHLFRVKLILKGLFDSMVEIKEEPQPEKEKDAVVEGG